MGIVCIVVPTLPLKNITLLFLANPPPSTLVFHETLPLKLGFFSEPQKHLGFSSLTAIYLLKVTKFLVEISQFELLVITEKNSFVYKLFLSLNISDFSLSFM